MNVGPLVSDALAQIDFHEALMHGMLSFLLFAGGLHVDFSDLASRKWSIALMATVGVLISTFIVGTLMWYALEFRASRFRFPRRMNSSP